MVFGGKFRNGPLNMSIGFFLLRVGLGLHGKMWQVTIFQK